MVRKVDHMEINQIVRGRGRHRKSIREVINKDLEINNLDKSMTLVEYYGGS